MADDISSEWVREPLFVNEGSHAIVLTSKVSIALQCDDTIAHSLQSSDVDLTGVRVGIPHEYFVKELPDEILRVWDKGIEWLRDAGMEMLHPRSLSHSDVHQLTVQ